MRQDRIRWNKKYADRGRADEAPSDIVRRFNGLVRPGWALDIAAGDGRDAFYLARRGFEVVAADISDTALAGLAGRHERLYPLCVDLDFFDIPENRFRLIINIRFLNRRLYPWIIDGLASGGLLIFETYIDFPSNKARRRSRDYSLDEGELLRVFSPLHILYYEETTQQTDEGAARLASLAAVKR